MIKAVSDFLNSQTITISAVEALKRGKTTRKKEILLKMLLVQLFFASFYNDEPLQKLNNQQKEFIIKQRTKNDAIIKKSFTALNINLKEGLKKEELLLKKAGLIFCEELFEKDPITKDKLFLIEKNIQKMFDYILKNKKNKEVTTPY